MGKKMDPSVKAERSRLRSELHILDRMDHLTNAYISSWGADNETKKNFKYTDAEREKLTAAYERTNR